MKTLKIVLLALFTITVAISCGEDKKKATKAAPKKIVEHYICPDKHEGGGSAAAGVCSKCQKTLLHNQAFHNDELLKNGPLTVPSNAAGESNAPTPAQTSPARNAAGVYHYTCKNGDAGGAGTAVNCKVCGELLVHNQAYHNQ